MSTSSSLLTRLTHTMRTLGTVNGLLYLVDQACRKATRDTVRLVKYRLVAQPIGTGLSAPVRAGRETFIEPAGPDHALAIEFPRPAHIIAARYAAGATCLVARVKDRFAGYLWWQREQYDEDEVRCHFVLASSHDSAWDFDVYVAPRYRLGRAMALLWQAAELRLAAEGVRWSFSRISAFNAESLASHARLGAVSCAQALFFVVGPVQVSLFTCAPYFHLSAGARSAPRLRLLPPTASPSAATPR